MKNMKYIDLKIPEHSYLFGFAQAIGIPYGKKSETVNPPSNPFSEKDYIRGLIDGDGSIGMRR
jgi:hypothetical protein